MCATATAEFKKSVIWFPGIKYEAARPVRVTDSTTERCTFSLELDASYAAELDLPAAADGWRCPRASGSDTADQCLFHRPVADKTPAETADALLAAIREPTAPRYGTVEAAKCFVGARLPALSLAHEVLESADTRPIDLREATFEGAFDLSRARVAQALDCRGAVFEAAVDFDLSTFEHAVGCNFARFESEATCRRVTFQGDLRCRKAEFRESLVLSAVTVDGETYAQDASFGSLLAAGATFEGTAVFRGATVDGACRFGDAVFADETDLQGVRFGGETTFADAVFRERTRLDPESVVDAPIDLRRATIETGRIDGPAPADHSPDRPTPDGRASTRVLYDCSESTLGAVTVGSTTSLAQFRVRETRFHGFDFTQSSLRDGLADRNWALPVDDAASDEGYGVLGDLALLRTDASAVTARYAPRESTYLRAKNGADGEGHGNAVAEFFRKEMACRRRLHLAGVLERGRRRRDRLRSLYRWAANATLEAVSGYGERPSRVVGASVLTIGCFSLLFALTWPGAPPYGSPGGYLVLSIESFVTLVLGGAAEVRSPWWLRLLAEVEGFLGVFLVALFVFTLTRSIHR
jgi:uncharacterized protein YjbI with pentapeptide repeats